MKIPDKEKLFKELTDLITSEQEKEFFVLCELKKNPSFSTGGLKRNNNGYDDCAIFMKFSDEPISQFNIPEEKTKSAHESFETAKNYYENTLGVYRIFHLKDGIKTILENNLWIPDADFVEENFIKRLDDWYWNEWCPYAANFLSKEDKAERSKKLNLVAEVLETKLKDLATFSFEEGAKGIM